MTVKPATDAEIAALSLTSRQGWPAEMRGLIERYPRECWRTHENLGGMAQFWLQRHGMFRELGASIEEVTAQFRAGAIPHTEFPRWFAPRLQFFLEQLQVHHRIEDGHYFPLLREADERLRRGFDVLEADHGALHDDIDRSVAAANGLLRAIGADADTLRRAADDYASAGSILLKGLNRHLDDEEDLIVPLILDRGEDELGVAHG